MQHRVAQGGEQIADPAMDLLNTGGGIVGGMEQQSQSVLLAKAQLGGDLTELGLGCATLATCCVRPHG